MVCNIIHAFCGLAWSGVASRSIMVFPSVDVPDLTVFL